MPIQLNSGRQEAIVAYVDISAGDLASGVATKAIELPSGAVVISGSVAVKTAFNTATTATLKVGDAVDDDRYTTSAVDLKTAGATALAITGYTHKVGESLQVTLTETGATATAGKVRVQVSYYVEGRAAFSQG
ncbi:Bacteriophage lambda head decoration protein D [Comamonas aquatilis]|uniref:hypothetical protein n=1 Tax=Comamonas aquatilis TaxID=1778406 RepID=UPI0039F0866D